MAGGRCCPQDVHGPVRQGPQHVNTGSLQYSTELARTHVKAHGKLGRDPWPGQTPLAAKGLFWMVACGAAPFPALAPGPDGSRVAA